MGEHLQDGAVEADAIEGHEAEQHEAHVADAGVADDEFEVFLYQCDHRSIEDADESEECEYISPRADAEDLEAPRIHAEGKERHGDAQAAVCAKLHDYTREQHGGAGGRGHVSSRCPGMKRPESCENREAYKDKREGPHLKVRGEWKVRQVHDAHGCLLYTSPSPRDGLL